MFGLSLSPNIKTIAVRLLDGQRISENECLDLWQEAPLALLGWLATEIKKRKSGSTVYYNRNFHIEPTNICTFKCRFCSYRRAADSPEAWDYSIDQIVSIAESYRSKNATEIHIVGGVHPDHDLYHYIQMISRVKEIYPQAVIKAFTAIELAYMIEKAGIGITEGLSLLKDVGMEAIPGGGAEIFDESLRSKICPEKGTTQQWLDIHEHAHKLGISTNATMLYGHIENIEHRIDHLRRLRELQDRTHGFNAFIPLKFRNKGNQMSVIKEVPVTEDMKVLAISRLYLDNFPHIKAYWPMFGKTITELALSFGADDIDGTIEDSTKIYSMAGAEEQNPSMSIAEIETIAKQAGFVAVERDTFYNAVKNK